MQNIDQIQDELGAVWGMAENALDRLDKLEQAAESRFTAHVLTNIDCRIHKLEQAIGALVESPGNPHSSAAKAKEFLE